MPTSAGDAILMEHGFRRMLHSFDQLEELLGLLGTVRPGTPWTSIGQVDNYVAGLAACPEAIAPSKWLPEV